MFSINNKIDFLLDIASNIEYPVRAYRLASAVVFKKAIVGLGVNGYKSDPFQLRFRKNPHAIHRHAEIGAIKNALKILKNTEDLSRCTLIVVRVKRNTSNTSYIPAMAKPCEGCYRCIVEFGIKKVCYTGEDGVLRVTFPI